VKLGSARPRAVAYTEQVAAKKLPFEVRRQHELAGLIALADKQYAAAAGELAQANQRDPRVLYHAALALQGAGDAKAARAMAARAADFNGLSFIYGYVLTKAKSLAAAK
jgi:hypothetical protein